MMESLREELRSARKENEGLRFMLEVTTRKCKMIQDHLRIRSCSSYYNDGHNTITTNYDTKRARIDDDDDDEKIAMSNKTRQVLVRTDLKDKTLVVRDGFQWRKYGQKVTKDNPFPRAYFRCSMAPTCSVKKKVQRSKEDKSILVASYDGEHNHKACGSPNDRHRDHHDQAARTAVPETISTNTLSPSTVTLELSLSGSCNTNHDDRTAITASSEVLDYHHDDLRKPVIIKESCGNVHDVEKLAACLTKDQSFTVALAEAVARSMTDHVYIA